MDVDKSLDEIIKSKPRNHRRGSTRRTSARTQVLGKAVPTPAQKARVTAPTEAKSEKIIVSNLPPDVNESQIRELFTTTVGPLRELNLHYDSAGRSKGVATVLFSRKGDGTKAFQTYNNRLIDGKRPMKIEIVVDPTAPVPLAQRVAPAPAAAATTSAPRTGGRPTRGGGGGGRGRRPRNKSERPAKSAADLDAEMEDYTASNAPATAA